MKFLLSLILLVKFPFEIESLEDIGEILDRSLINKKDILNKIKKFNPDAIIVSGWKDNLYLNICRYFKKKNSNNFNF